MITKEHPKIANSNGISSDLLYQRIETLKWNLATAMTKKLRRKREYRMNTQYTVYKSDEVIVSGTARECAEFMGIKLQSFYHYLTPAYERRMKKRNAKNI